MGASSSVKQLKRIETRTISLMMPTYYDESSENEILPIHHNKCREGWSAILNDSCPRYVAMKASPTFKADSCFGWFVDIFAERLLNIHPDSERVFPDRGTLSKFLILLISATVHKMGDDEDHSLVVSEFASKNNERGLKPVEYGIIGDVIFYSLSVVLGTEFDVQADQAWKIKYSKFLKLIVPHSIEHARVSSNCNNSHSDVPEQHTPNNIAAKRLLNFDQEYDS